MEDDWAPKPNVSVDVRKLPLNAEEGFVLSRLDGSTSVEKLPIITGFPPVELRAILTRLVHTGAVLPPLEAGAAPVAATPSRPEANPPATVAAASRSVPAGPAVRETEAQVEPSAQSAEAHEPNAEEAKAAEPAETPEEEAAAAEKEPTFRALFEQRLHELPAEQRCAMAQTAGEPELSALCFDPLPAVIKALFQNPKAGLAHARLVARHHRNPVGLEAVAERSAFAVDTGVRRWLIRNPQLSVGLVRRLYQGRRLLEQYKLSQDRDIPEGSRRTLRELVRARFASAQAEERVELIVTTDGRALNSLSGLPVDGKTTSMLCARPYSSTLFIQNIARWSAAPPPLIAHLLRQETVRRQPSLRQMLKRHPNAPSTA